MHKVSIKYVYLHRNKICPIKKQEKKKSNPKDLITKQLKKDLGKSFEVQQLTEEKSDKGGYLLYSINLANK